MTIHLRNGRAAPGRTLTHNTVRGVGQTWCGKKLIGEPDEVSGDGIETFIVYGNRIEVAADPSPEIISCQVCRDRFDTAYAAEFPDGLQPLATFRTDNPGDVERARSILNADNLRRVLGPGGGGIAELTEQLRSGEPS
jgi:hypothetical protein